MPDHVSPPRTEEELLRRARALDGLTAGELARRLGAQLDGRKAHVKGRIGELIELALGASAGNQDQPDFPALGIELKSVPLDAAGHVRESTFVCAVDLRALEREEWLSSRVWRKLRRVLWVPVEASALAPVAERHLGTARLWEPTAAQQRTLRADWTELVGRMALGGIDDLSAHLGQALQIRPKARSGADRTLARGPEGEPLDVVPRGFYLRARFTEEILWS
jgi:DNA mismatch repair protein MutH